MASISAEFSFYAQDHKPENYDIVVNLGQNVLDENGRATGEVYVYAASYTAEDELSNIDKVLNIIGLGDQAGVSGDIIKMKKSDLEGASNVYSYGSDLGVQVEAHADALVDNALGMQGVESLSGEDANQYSGTRFDVHRAYQGVETKIKDMGPDAQRGVGRDVYGELESMRDELKDMAELIDHLDKFKADMASDIAKSGLDDLKSDASSKPAVQQNVTMNMGGQ